MIGTQPKDYASCHVNNCVWMSRCFMVSDEPDLSEDHQQGAAA